MQKKQLNKTREQLIQGYIDCLTQDTLPCWEQGWISRERPKNATTDKRYRGVNSALLSLVSQMKGYSDPRWATFKQASDHGWKIKKGEHGTPIEYWYLWDQKNKKNIEPADAQKEIAKDPSRKQDFFYRSRTYTIFNCQQMENVPEYSQPVFAWDKGTCTNFTLDVVGALGVEYIEDGKDGCYYRPSADQIHMPSRDLFFDEYAFCSSLLHECSHASMDNRRLNVFDHSDHSEEAYAKEELVAEMSASFVCGELGIGMTQEHIENHKSYIKSWIKMLQDDPQVLFDAIQKAETVSEYIGKISELDKVKETLDLSMDREMVE